MSTKPPGIIVGWTFMSTKPPGIIVGWTFMSTGLVFAA